MPVTFNEKFLAYLALISGLVISIVAEYYSILGLAAIFAAAVIPVIIMGIALGIGKITATLWLKQNWDITHWSIKIYLVLAIAVLMLITSMGIFGFLSKAHSDQSLVSGDVQSKIAIYDEKIKTARENIEANRRQLKQMDEAVDQVMARSDSERGAERANTIRRSQQRDRVALAKDIETNQKLIASLNDESAPIRAEIRKVEAEVGPIKYIAAFVYGDTDKTVLEKSVTWVIIILIIVFDPLALILLLASQISFANFRKRNLLLEEKIEPAPTSDIQDLQKIVKEGLEKGSLTIQGQPEESTITVSETIIISEPISAIIQDTTESSPVETSSSTTVSSNIEPDNFSDKKETSRTVITGTRRNPVTKIFKSPPKTYTSITEELVQKELEEQKVSNLTSSTHEVLSNDDGNYIVIDGQTYHKNSIPERLRSYVQNEEQKESGVWSKVKKNEE